MIFIQSLCVATRSKPCKTNHSIIGYTCHFAYCLAQQRAICFKIIEL